MPQPSWLHPPSDGEQEKCPPPSPSSKEIPARTPGTRRPLPERTEGALIAIRALADEGLALDAPSLGGGSWGHLTLTSQMLMPPSIPVVQNCEQLAFPPASTEIWLGGTKRQRGGQPGPPQISPGILQGSQEHIQGMILWVQHPQGDPEPNLSPPKPSPLCT